MLLSQLSCPTSTVFLYLTCSVRLYMGGKQDSKMERTGGLCLWITLLIPRRGKGNILSSAGAMVADILGFHKKCVWHKVCEASLVFLQTRMTWPQCPSLCCVHKPNIVNKSFAFCVLAVNLLKLYCLTPGISLINTAALGITITQLSNLVTVTKGGRRWDRSIAVVVVFAHSMMSVVFGGTRIWLHTIKDKGRKYICCYRGHHMLRLMSLLSHVRAAPRSAASASSPGWCHHSSPPCYHGSPLSRRPSSCVYLTSLC